MSDSEHVNTFQPLEIEEVVRLFPSYDIHHLIDCGGMGAVYQATQRSLDRLVAIKILPREFSVNEEFRSSFESEAKAMAKLNHPNLIGVYDFGEVDGMLFIVMEYVAGKSLYHSTQGNAVEQADAVRLVIDTCTGLENAHQYGILHRDIKPANILLDSNANPKIGDFGLAKPLENKIEEGEQIFGTPGYTAPEVLELPYTFDQRADIFSVGVMLHELLTGQLPGADSRPVSQQSGCDPRLDAVIRKATHPDPNFRYLSAADLAKDLQAIVDSGSRAVLTSGAARAPAKSIYSPKKYGSQKSSSGGMVALLLLIAVGVMGALVFISTKKKPGAVPAVGSSASGDQKPAGSPSASAVPTFIAEERSRMSDEVLPLIKAHRDKLAANVRELEQGLALAILQLDQEGQTALNAELKSEAARWKAGGSEVAARLPANLAGLPGAEELHEAALETQSALNLQFAQETGSLGKAYVRALTSEIDRLKSSGNEETIAALRVEIGTVEGDRGYFVTLFE